MKYSSNKLYFIHYADDTTASVVGNDIRNVIQTANYELLISLPFPLITQYTHSFYYRAINARNLLPVLLRKSNSLCVFRKKTETFYYRFYIVSSFMIMVRILFSLFFWSFNRYFSLSVYYVFHRPRNLVYRE